MRADGEVLRLTVSDDGPPAPDGALDGVPDGGHAHGPAPGHGIAGMRERAEALGGTLTAGREDTGFVVRAVLPLNRPAERPA